MPVVAVLCFLLLLSGCASIPFATMAKLSQFNGQSIAQLDPEQMLVKVSVGNSYSLKPNSTRLQLSSKPDHSNKKTEAVLSLKQLSQAQEKRSVGFFSPDLEVVTYQFAIDQAGAETLKQMQQQFIKAGHKGAVSFTVETGFDHKNNADIKKDILLWVDLKLFEKEDYISLIDAAALKVEAI